MGTEFRQFLLYTGPIVLKKVLTKDMYEHFLCLSVGMSILLESDNETRNFYLNYAQELLTYFVTKSKEFYHPKFIVYNVHSSASNGFLLFFTQIHWSSISLSTNVSEHSAFPLHVGM